MQTNKLGIYLSRVIFKLLLSFIRHAETQSQKYCFAQLATNFAINRHTGYYSSAELENFYLSLAQQYPCKASQCTPKGNSFLHVFSCCYQNGGHTRIVERWIQSCPSEEIHSVVLIAQAEEAIPSALTDAIREKNGRLYELTVDDDITKALQLRSLALNYERVILHSHPHDPIPLIAFGTEQFPRPIILYNHADHAFWLGVSIADCVFDLNTSGATISKTRRDVHQSHILNIPIDPAQPSIEDKCPLRQRYQLPLTAKILLSIGTSFKYDYAANFDFIPVASKILNQQSDILLIVIGPIPTLPKWQQFAKKYPSQVIILDAMPYPRLQEYIMMADVYLDSPASSFTALIDVIYRGVPGLLLKNFCRPQDFQLRAASICQNEAELITRTVQLLNDESRRQAVATELLSQLQQDHGITHWQAKLQLLLKQAPKTHTIHRFSDVVTVQPFDIHTYKIAKACHQTTGVSVALIQSNLRPKNSGQRCSQSVKLLLYKVASVLLKRL